MVARTASCAIERGIQVVGHWKDSPGRSGASLVQKKNVVMSGIDGSEPCVETYPERFATAALPLTHGDRAQDSSLNFGIAMGSIAIGGIDGHD
jgi:hypothetical protein